MGQSIGQIMTANPCAIDAGKTVDYAAKMMRDEDVGLAPIVEGPNGVVYSGVVSGMRLCPPDGTDPFAQFNSKALYRDDVQSFSTVEPAIDLTATSPLAFARQMAGLY